MYLNMLNEKLDYYYNRIHLYEYSYKELKKLYDDDFLNQKQRERYLKRSNVETWNDNIMKFKVPSSMVHKNNKVYINMIQLINFDKVIEDTELSANESARLLIWVGDIKLHCTCPSFKYHGYQYLLTALNSAIYEDNRKPKRMNPMERGIVCKHLRRTLNVFPFYSGSIAKKVKQERERRL